MDESTIKREIRKLPSPQREIAEGLRMARLYGSPTQTIGALFERPKDEITFTIEEDGVTTLVNATSRDGAIMGYARSLGHDTATAAAEAKGLQPSEWIQSLVITDL